MFTNDLEGAQKIILLFIPSVVFLITKLAEVPGVSQITHSYSRRLPALGLKL